MKGRNSWSCDSSMCQGPEAGELAKLVELKERWCAWSFKDGAEGGPGMRLENVCVSVCECECV